MLKLHLDDTVVRSPVEGTIISRTVEVGTSDFFSDIGSWWWNNINDYG